MCFGQDDRENQRKDENDENCGDPGGRSCPCRGEKGEGVGSGSGDQKEGEANDAIVFEATFRGRTAGQIGAAHKVRLVCLSPRCSL